MTTPGPRLLGPDGLPVRSVGRWEPMKAFYVDRHATIFANGMKKWTRLAYVELFAGPGLLRNRDTGEYVDGSAVRALARRFTDYVFVDIDAGSVAALEARVAARARPGVNAKVLPPMDCNDAVEAILDRIPRRALTLAFIDPTNWQVRLDTIERLVEGRRVDLLMTFWTGSMLRMEEVEDTDKLDAFFGTSAWRGALQAPRKVDALLDLYNRQLEPFGYQASTHQHRVPILNSRNSAMYQLVVFSKHPLGDTFWRAAIEAPAPGTLWGW